VRYKPSSDGAYVPGFSGRDGDVKPGQTWTYRLEAVKASAGVWPYHDHSPSMEQSIAGGLYGTLSILGRHDRRPDREFVVYFENSPSFAMIDGRAFVGNTPVMRSRVGDLVQWDVLAMGSEHHTFHVHGHRWREHGTPLDTKTLGPAESFRIRWRENSPGTWLYHCHVEQHMMLGMVGIYRVSRSR
jgi:FtsP/CotA-like multicopper oxidase with cupredoxin domain